MHIYLWKTFPQQWRAIAEATHDRSAVGGRTRHGTAGPMLVILHKGSMPAEAVALVWPAVRRAGCVLECPRHAAAGEFHEWPPVASVHAVVCHKMNPFTASDMKESSDVEEVEVCSCDRYSDDSWPRHRDDAERPCPCTGTPTFPGSKTTTPSMATRI